jgi:hypothetical protein
MDALPIQEATGLPYANRLPGKMHACGHDGHTAILLAAAHQPAKTRDLKGTLNVIFQPAEEGLGGAVSMMNDGLFDRFPCDAAFALHNAPGVPLGKFIVRSGAMAASSDSFTITLTGEWKFERGEQSACATREAHVAKVDVAHDDKNYRAGNGRGRDSGGTVPTTEELSQATNLAASVAGVTPVNNRLTVNPIQGKADGR